MSVSRRAVFTQLFLAGFVNILLGKNASADGVTYTYDEIGRLVRVDYSNGRSVQYVYDPAGNRTIVTSGELPPPPPPPPAPSGAFAASPTTIAQGGSSTLSWTSTNATGASISHGIGMVTPIAGGSLSVSPTATTTYTLTLSGPGGSTPYQATVNVGWSETIQITGTGPVNLRTLANTAGYNGTQDATVTFQVGNGVTIVGAAGAAGGGAGGDAIDTGAWPTGDYNIALTLEVLNGGIVRGGGGAGGTGASSEAAPGIGGGAGGDAINCQLPCAVIVQSGGTVIGGGGGGGGGGGWAREPSPGGSNNNYNGGGGGGGYPNGPAGLEGQTPTFDVSGPGSAGTISGGGAGGSGGSAGGGRTTAAGGAGGSAASGGAAGGVAAGATGSSPGHVDNRKITPGAGGNAGYAIRKNGHTVPVTNNGTITGTQA